MKKLLSAVLLFFCASPAFAAGNGTGPTVPWPTSIVNKHELMFEDLRGEWVGYGQNSVWFVHIDYNFSSPDGLASIEIKSNALFNSFATGWLQSWNKIFWGEMTMDDSHKTSFIIYRDVDGTKLRLGKNAKSYFDVILYRK